jgi:hypothetical protein
MLGLNRTIAKSRELKEVYSGGDETSKVSITPVVPPNELLSIWVCMITGRSVIGQLVNRLRRWKMHCSIFKYRDHRQSPRRFPFPHSIATILVERSSHHSQRWQILNLLRL